VSTLKRLRRLIPPWEMPSDPVKAIWWFLHWLLKIVVNFFWFPVLVLVVYETYLNMVAHGVGSGIVSGLVSLLIGLVLWAVLYGLLLLVNIITGITHVLSDVKNMQQQQNEFLRQSSGSPFDDLDTEYGRRQKHERVVEGSITEIDNGKYEHRRQ
jgi:hypothetical protein